MCIHTILATYLVQVLKYWYVTFLLGRQCGPRFRTRSVRGVGREDNGRVPERQEIEQEIIFNCPLLFTFIVKHHPSRYHTLSITLTDYETCNLSFTRRNVQHATVEI